MKKSWIIIMTVLMVMLTACSGTNETRQNPAEEADTDKTEETVEMKSITMTINEEKMEVVWENNESVKALAELASEEPLVIDASMYGGFEQVGPIGTTLPSNDINIRTNPGDIVLYTGSNIVVCYGNNSWDYTMLGHIEGKSEDELEELLSGNNVTFRFSAE